MSVLVGMRSLRRRLVPTGRRGWRAGATALSVLSALSATVVVGTPLTVMATHVAAATPPSTNVVLVGHGYGHGIGMGQWGSLGYALGDDGGAGNYTYEQILSHYYGGTVMAEVNATVQLSPKVIVPCAATAVASSASVGQEVKD